MAVDTIARALALKAEGGTTPPDLSNYVQFDDYATQDKAGVINSGSNGFSVDVSGNTSADVYTSEQYGGLGDNSFISKGTLENAKEQYISSSTTVQNIINSENSDLPKYNVEGTDNTITDALDKQLFALSGDGKSEQETTTGKNLLPYPYSDTTKTENGITFTDNGDGTITVNGTATAGVFFKVFATQTNQEEIPGNYISGSVTGCNIVVAHKQDTEYTSLGISTNGSSSLINKETYATGYIELSILQGATLNNVIVKPMLTLEQDTSYEPYTGLKPSPSPDYPQEINSIEGSVEFDCRGKNLLNNILTSGTRNGITYTVNEDKSIILNGTATTITWLILNNSITFSAGTYTMSQGNDNNNVRMFCNALNGYTQNGVRTATLTEEKTSDVSVNIPEGTTVSNLTIYPMIKESATLTEYEPYQSNQVTFNLNDEKLRSVGDVKDELVVDLDTGDYYKVEKISEIILDGSIDFYQFSDVNKYGNILFVNYNALKDKRAPANYINYPNVISNYFKETLENIWVGNIVAIDVDDSQIILVVPQTLATTSEELKAWLQQRNVVVDYRLANPQTVPLGTLSSEDLAKLKTFKGYNNVTVNTNLGFMNIRFTYGLDVKKYVDNKLAEISAQLIRGE